LEEQAENQIIAYSEKLKLNNYTVDDYKKGQYNFRTTIQQGHNKLSLFVYFGKNGLKTILQGEASDDFTDQIKKIIGFRSTISKTSVSEEPIEYIGTDESGKGDYFGPLVVAGVYVNSESINLLKKIGVRDSKELTDKNIISISSGIFDVVKDNYNVIVITPSTYNKLHSSMKNVNRILGWAHAKVIENILQKKDVSEAISDKFGDENLILNALQQKGKNIKLSQFTKAERFTGVAAASILARNKFINWFSEAKNKYEVDLPKGASAEVIRVGKLFNDKFGNEILNQVAKIHFKTTKQIIN
jgi:ribonuclease HIII